MAADEYEVAALVVSDDCGHTNDTTGPEVAASFVSARQVPHPTLST